MTAMTALSQIPGSPASLAQVALALAAADVRSDHDHAQVERQLSRAAATLRQADLEAGRRELRQAADKALAGGLIAAGFQLVAASCQFQQASALAAGDQVAAKACEAQASLNQAFAKGGDLLAATGQYDQADKLRLDQAAESLQEARQESQRAIASDDDGRRRGLAAMKELADRAYETARAAARA